jgi:superfamily II DNA or RNA helicase
MEPITDIATYLRANAQELGYRILESHPPLHAIDDPPSPLISKLLRKPYPAQTLAIMGLVRRWQQARAGAVIAECGTGKT